MCDADAAAAATAWLVAVALFTPAVVAWFVAVASDTPAVVAWFVAVASDTPAVVALFVAVAAWFVAVAALFVAVVVPVPAPAVEPDDPEYAGTTCEWLDDTPPVVSVCV